MKRNLVIGIMLAVLMTLFTSAAVFAADPPTTVNVNWSGAGGVGTTVNAGSTVATFNTGGNSINGSYTAVDSNNNPYGYGVDSFSSQFNGSVINGFMVADCSRNTSYVPMYGGAGQYSYSFVGTDGAASMAYRSTTNYAQMVDATYGYQLPGGHNVVITGATSYLVDRGISDGRGNSGQVLATGSGAATLDCMSAEASGVWDLKLGRGAGCYTDANFNGTGAGTFQATVTGNSFATFNGMGVSIGGGTLQFIANWLGNIGVADYSMTAH